MVIEQQVDLAECAVLGLRKAEPTPDEAEQIRTCVEEAGFGAPVPCYVASANVKILFLV
jgi:hypothetical protein